jgi:spermidine synthase
MENPNNFNPSDTIDLWVHEKSNDNFSMSFRVKDVLFSDRSPYQKVQIVDTFGYGKMLFNDGLVMISEADEYIYHEMITHVPLFLHPEPKKVLVVGGGDGGTVREVLKHPSVEHCTLCEIDAMVINACKKYIPLTAGCLDENDERLTIRCQDAVEFIKEVDSRFDVVIIDSSDPIGPAAPLFNDSFYKDVEAHLTEKGIVVAQAESPFIYADEQKGLLAILRRQFKHTFIYNFTNMTYPGGLWSFSLASQTELFPRKGLDGKRFDRLALDLKYYTKETHKAAFNLPKFQEENLSGLIDPAL